MAGLVSGPPASRTVTSAPASPSRRATTEPAVPAPTTITSMRPTLAPPPARDGQPSTRSQPAYLGGQGTPPPVAGYSGTGRLTRELGMATRLCIDGQWTEPGGGAIPTL